MVWGFVLASAPGCTFIGLAVGASTPNIETYGDAAAGVAGGPALAKAIAARDIALNDVVEVDLERPPALDSRAGPDNKVLICAFRDNVLSRTEWINTLFHPSARLRSARVATTP